MDVDEALLDDPELLAKADPGGMLRAVATSGAQVRQAVQFCRDSGLHRLGEGGRPRAIVVATRLCITLEMGFTVLKPDLESLAGAPLRAEGRLAGAPWPASGRLAGRRNSPGNHIG